MAEIVRKGRGFNSGSSEPTDGRLDRPIFMDEEPDREDIVLTAKPSRRNNYRASFTSPPPETNGGVKVSTPPPTSQSQGPEKPDRRIARPAMVVFAPPHRRQPLSSEQQQTIHKPGVDISGMDFSRATKVSPHVQTLDQALREQSIGSGKSKEQAPPVSGLRLESPPTEPKAPPTKALREQSIGSGKPKEQAPPVSSLRLESPPTEPKAPPTKALREQSIGSGKSKEQAPPMSGLRLQGPPTEPKAPNIKPKGPNIKPTAPPIEPKAPTEPKAPHATPAPTKVLTKALKSLPPRGPPRRRFRNSAIPSGPAVAIQVAEVVTQEIPLQDEPIVDHSSETPAAVTMGAPQHHEPTTGSSPEISAVATGVIDIQVEESLASTANLTSVTEELEPYQLGAGERFASESSDESESVTSTINDYDNVSESGTGSGDEIVRKKIRKPKPVETSDGKVYYPIAVDEEPYVPLTYGIPLEDFTRLSSLNDESKLKYWTYDLYRHEEKQVSVECCTTLEEFETAAQKFLEEKAIGFDMEWLPRPSKKVW